MQLGSAAHLHDIGIPVDVDGQSWVTNRHFITNAYVDNWTNGQRTSFNLGERITGSKLAFFLRGKIRIDDLKIEEISTNELPDVQTYLEAIARIPPDKRTGSVPLPGLAPAKPGKQVTIIFASESHLHDP
jgi:hypothetical protein